MKISFYEGKVVAEGQYQANKPRAARLNQRVTAINPHNGALDEPGLAFLLMENTPLMVERAVPRREGG